MSVFPARLSVKITPGHQVCLQCIEDYTGWSRTQSFQFALKALELFLDHYRNTDTCVIPQDKMLEIEHKLQLT